MWTDLGWFICHLEVRIWIWSSAAWPPTFLYWSFSALYSSSVNRGLTVILQKRINTSWRKYQIPLENIGKKMQLNLSTKGPQWGFFRLWQYIFGRTQTIQQNLLLNSNHVLYILCCRWSIMIEERPLSASRSSSIETLDTPVSVFGLSLLSRHQHQGA